MIGRRLLLLDRLAALLLGVLLIAVGVAGVWWWFDHGSLLPTKLSTGAATDLVATSWWPWASGAAGVVLVLLGLRWAAAHISNPRFGPLALPGSSTDGKLTLDMPKAVGAAAEAYADTVGVRSARGIATRDRGQLVALVRATIEPEADLHRLAERADQVSAELAQLVGRPDLRFGVELRVARRGRALRRVE